MRIIFLGAPGSGKGTQSKKVAAKLSIPQLSTGDILRAAVKEGTEIGKQAQKIMESGGLVSDEIMLGIIKDRTAQDDCAKGFILDGFPRTLIQAEKLTENTVAEGKEIDRVIYLEIDQKLLLERLTGRRVCSSCGAEYHIKYKAPKEDGICDADGKELIHRADDHEEKIINRLDNYEKQTAPLVEYYQNSGVLKTVLASGDIDTITEKILAEV